MPPKRKIVKKTVRKTKAKSEPEPEPVIESSPPPAEETLAPEPSPEPEPATAAAATKVLEKEPEPAAPQETLAEEPGAMDVSGGDEPAATETLAAELADAEEAEEKPKMVTRVRKVVKKKIVKKLVPKAAAAAKEGSFKEEESPKEESPKVAVEEVQKVEEEAAVEVNTTEEQQEIENPISDDAPAPMETAPETEAHDAEKAEVAALGAEKVDDAPKEEEKGGDLEMEVAGNEDAGVPEKSSRKKTEIFVGGLDRDAKEEDLRKVFGEVGEIDEVRMIMDGQSGKNKGYAFVRYADASQAKKAVTQFEKVEVMIYNW